MSIPVDRANRTTYPFRSAHMDVDAGRMHYVDEGEGPVVVMVHGTPTSSFLYRHLIRDLSQDHRVIAMDHIGFGRSDKPEDWSYRPEDHARNLELLIERLELQDVTLVVHDFGGPIGLAYAIEHPQNVRALALFNTWMWSLKGTAAERVSRFMSGAVGRFLYKQLNFSPRVLLRTGFADKRKLTKEIHRHYIEAFPSAAERQGPWVLAKELIDSADFYEGLWQRRRHIEDKPALLLWGMKDPFFDVDSLDRWNATFTSPRVVRFPEAGHFVQEEAGDEAAREIRVFLSAVR